MRSCARHTLEGPCVLRRDGLYDCNASGPDGPRVLRGVPDHVIGPGLHFVVVGPDRMTRFLCYHACDPAMTARQIPEGQGRRGA